MSRPPRMAPWLLVLMLWIPVRAEDEPVAATVRWSEDIPTAMAEAKEAQKVLMVCVNARHVLEREREEPAAGWLREVIYPDERVVEKSRQFVCVLLDAEGSSEEFGELRALGIGGDLVSPQHIFVHPDGTSVLHRVEFWSHGKGESAVKAMLAMMEKAQRKWRGDSQTPEPPEGEEKEAPDPADGAARTAWIVRMVQQVVQDDERGRRTALDALVRNDRDGDGTGPLIGLLESQKKSLTLLVDLIRALGRDGLESAALPIASLLGHKDEDVRGNAAVSLEYVGSQDKKVVAALRKAADKEKDQEIANHMYRALGRCGVEDGKARALLLKRAGGAKSEFASYGPIIGLAYFESDKKAARGVEKLLKKIGIPGGRRGGAQNTVKRGLLSWALAAIGDEKSAKFMREELMPQLENVKAFWVEGLLIFYDTVARTCDGDDSAMAEIERGVRGFVQFALRGNLGRYGAETRSLMDEYRTGRDTTTFRPKGDSLLGDATDE